jgi:hypothetical protein
MTRAEPLARDAFLRHCVGFVKGGEFMSEQRSQKRGVRSEAQKEAKARGRYAPIPPANAVGGAFGERNRDTPTDEGASLAAAGGGIEPPTLGL